MTEYNVTWTIELDAASPEDAALLAADIQGAPERPALVFTVTEPGAFRARDRDPVTIDLNADNDA